MNGWEVLRQLKDPVSGLQRKPGPRPKVIVISGRNEEETVEFVRRLGADAYMMKPLWGDEVLATVRGVLEA
jgi:DNA-binding response OmpR family regulator